VDWYRCQSHILYIALRKFYTEVVSVTSSRPNLIHEHAIMLTASAFTLFVRMRAAKSHRGVKYMKIVRLGLFFSRMFLVFIPLRARLSG